MAGRWGVLAGAAIASAAGAGCVREASCWARVERCCGSLGFCAAAVTEEGGAGSADRLTANRWLSGSAFWLFVGQGKGLEGCEVSPQAGFARCLLLGAFGLSGSRERQADLRIGI